METACPAANGLINGIHAEVPQIFSSHAARTCEQPIDMAYSTEMSTLHAHFKTCCDTRAKFTRKRPPLACSKSTCSSGTDLQDGRRALGTILVDGRDWANRPAATHEGVCGRVDAAAAGWDPYGLDRNASGGALKGKCQTSQVRQAPISVIAQE